ncbi:HDOD domain-containing protein [Amphritea sp. HPY]|uniref:HDOD domain-containing protein n=1 Tax=Amphritea sp. HPY TaxID=3421652 RepID=UPI003D7C5486
MATEQIPQNASQWTTFLAAKKLPVRASALARLNKKIGQSNTSLMELSKTIKSDPVLCLHVVILAGTLHQEKDSEVTSIDHAISSLGMQKLEQLISSLPEIKLSPKSVAHKMYFRAIANSHHAATQARQWLQLSRGGMFAEESYLAALFYGAGHWLLWQFAPLHMSQIQILIREQGIAPELAESKILGCTVAAISKGLIERWHASPLALHTLKQESPLSKQVITKLHQRALGDPRLKGDDLRSLNHLIQQKFFPIHLANLLAWNASYGWQNDKTLNIIDIISDYLKIELGSSISLLHKNCALSARQYHVVGTLSPAAEMLMLPSKLQAGYKLSKAEQQHFAQKCPVPLSQKPAAEKNRNAESAPVSSDYLNATLFADIAKKLLKQPEQFTQASEVLAALVSGLTEGLGMTRVALHIVSTRDESLKVIRATGFEAGHPLPNSSHKLASNSLFLRLYEKNSCIMVNESNRQRIKGLLPGSYSRYLSDSNYLLMSVFVGNKPVAVVYADRDGKAGGAQDFHHEKFKYLCTAAGECLKTVTKNKNGN